MFCLKLSSEGKVKNKISGVEINKYSLENIPEGVTIRDMSGIHLLNEIEHGERIIVSHEDIATGVPSGKSYTPKSQTKVFVDGEQVFPFLNSNEDPDE